VPDSYVTFPNKFVSRGVVARYADDTLPQGTYLNEQNCEEQTENTITSRLGSTIINRTGTTINALPAGVHSLGRLLGLDSTSWRYAGAGQVLYRRNGDTQGAYTQIAAGMSGGQWSSAVYRPTLSSYPYLFIADAGKMLKDNGSFTNPQQWGIFAPSFPVRTQIQPPLLQTWNGAFSSTGFSNYVNFTSPISTTPVNTTTTNAVTGGSVVTIIPASMTNIMTGQLLFLNLSNPNVEIVYVLSTTTNSFTAFCTNNHAAGETITWFALNGSVATSTTATITYPNTPGSFPPLGIFADGPNTKSGPEDYINFNIFLDHPNNLQQINLLFDVGDGSFTQDYFIKSYLPSIQQPLVSGTETAEQAAVNQVFAEAVGLTTDSLYNPAYLNTGDNTFNFMRVKLKDFAAVGNADPNGAQFNWNDTNAFQIQIITNTNGSVNVSFNNMFLSGGYGPDSYGGVAYDYLYTYYNANTGMESNPCMFMSEALPTTGLGYFPARFPLPFRQPILLELTASTDTQVTHFRIYRRGGTLAGNFYRVDQIPIAQTTYLDTTSDAQLEGAATISFTNDVPVTSTLPVPVNTTLTSALNPPMPGAFSTIFVSSTTNISTNQQVTIGADNDPNQEIVIAGVVSPGSFQAYVQNPHKIGDPVTAEAFYGQPCYLCAVAYNAMWLAGDPNNPHYLYYSTNFSPEAFGSANFIEVGIPSDPITAIIPFQGTLYVATRDHWYLIAPSSGASPTVYPTTAVHGVYAPFGWTATETEIWHVAIDGIRTFAGNASTYRSQEIEFVFQGGTTPVAQADFSNLELATMAYRDNMVFCGYKTTGGPFSRLIYHTVYQRFRNDTIPATAMFVESDTNLLLYGDANGIIHQDRIGVIDEASNAGTLQNQPISLNLQTAFLDQGFPKNQKNYNELTLDVDTQGQTVQVALSFDDGEEGYTVGTVNTANRQKVNLNLQNGLGTQAYRVSLVLTGNVSQKVTFYQADIRAVVLAETRQSFDTYWLPSGAGGNAGASLGPDESKLCKNAYIEYNSTAPLTANFYYDQMTSPGYTFTLPASTRIATRIRLPAIKYRLMRVTITSTADFQIWPSSHLQMKPIIATKGYYDVNLPV